MPQNQLLENVHVNLQSPCKDKELVKGKYSYFHYNCDVINDKGWGCGYRTLQTIMSWIQFNGTKKSIEIPGIREIQEALFKCGDKEVNFVGSTQWIGSFEIMICLEYFYNVSCKIHHLREDEKLIDHVGVLRAHFKDFGSPVMMGGNTDSASKCILGICDDKLNSYLLILDPHYFSQVSRYSEVIEDKWISWRNVDSFDEMSFYNFCLPQVKTIQ